MSELLYQFCHLESDMPSSKCNNSVECQGHEGCTVCEAYGKVCTFAAHEAGDSAEAALKRLTKHCPEVFSSSHPLENVRQLDNSDVKLGNKLGRGGYCSVYACDLVTANNETKDKNSDPEKGQKSMPYALKRLKREIMVHPLDLMYGAVDLASEAAFLANLSHPNIISLHGIASGTIHERIEHTDYHDKGDGFFIVIDRLQETLDQRLHVDWKTNHANVNPKKKLFRQRSVNQIKSEQALLVRLQVAIQIADAIEYLHSHGIMYRDLKPENVGFDTNDKVKLFDFGLACCKKISEELAGSRRYMAPEVVRCKPYDKSVDVYSFGMLLWEILAIERPFDHMSRREHYVYVVQQNERPRIVGWWPRTIQELMGEAWNTHPVLRPTMRTILYKLQKVAEGIKIKLDAENDQMPGWKALKVEPGEL